MTKLILAGVLTLLPLQFSPGLKKVPALGSLQQDLIQASKDYLEVCERQAGADGCSVSLLISMQTPETPASASFFISLESPGMKAQSEQGSDSARYRRRHFVLP